MCRHHDPDYSYKRKHLIEVTSYSFRDLVHFHQGGEQGGLQADIVHGTSEGNRKWADILGSSSLSIYETLKLTATMR